MLRLSCCRATSECVLFFFFFNDTATTEIYTLSLHDALPISACFRRPVSARSQTSWAGWPRGSPRGSPRWRRRDRKSTRLNSSHGYISYAVFCLKKKKKNYKQLQVPHASNTEALIVLMHTTSDYPLIQLLYVLFSHIDLLHP